MLENQVRPKETLTLTDLRKDLLHGKTHCHGKSRSFRWLKFRLWVALSKDAVLKRYLSFLLALKYRFFLRLKWNHYTAAFFPRLWLYNSLTKYTKLDNCINIPWTASCFCPSVPARHDTRRHWYNIRAMVVDFCIRSIYCKKLTYGI